MVVLLPTFGFTTVNAIIIFAFLPEEAKTDAYRWECIFLPDSGAFFVNYVITAGFVGASLELLRIADLLIYMGRVIWSKSKAEGPAIQKASAYEFRFGEQYARIMLIFCMMMVFSLSCPLITPFGLAFFTAKHYVDRHNVIYAYRPSKTGKATHASAIGFVILSVVVLQFFMMIFFLIRSGSELARFQLTLQSEVMIGIFFVCVNVFSAQLWADTCRKLSPIEYVEATVLRDDVEYYKDVVYLPDVLNPEKTSEKPEQTGYGTFNEEAGPNPEVPLFPDASHSSPGPNPEVPLFPDAASSSPEPIPNPEPQQNSESPQPVPEEEEVLQPLQDQQQQDARTQL